MDGLILLRKASEAGLTVSTWGTKLVIRGPRRAEPVARLLLKHKPVVMAALGHPRPEPERAGWDAADWRGYFKECVALRLGLGHPQPQAEVLAWGELLSTWHKANASPPPRALCAGCGEPLSGAEVMDIWDGARVHDVPGFACLIRYGKCWRAATIEVLAALGIEPPRGEQP